MTTPTNFIIDDKPPTSAKRGPGRPKGSTSKPRAATGATDAATLKQALASLDSLYNIATVGLTMLGLTNTAEQWTNSMESLKASNEDALKAAPRLAASIANAGSVGGAAAFFGAHLIAVAPVVAMARMEMSLNRAARAEKMREAQPGDIPQQDTSFVPGV